MSFRQLFATHIRTYIRRKKLPKWHLYGKCARLTLMKLTASFSTVQMLFLSSILTGIIALLCSLYEVNNSGKYKRKQLLKVSTFFRCCKSCRIFFLSCHLRQNKMCLLDSHENTGLLLLLGQILSQKYSYESISQTSLNWTAKYFLMHFQHMSSEFEQ